MYTHNKVVCSHGGQTRPFWLAQSSALGRPESGGADSPGEASGPEAAGVSEGSQGSRVEDVQ